MNNKFNKNYQKLKNSLINNDIVRLYKYSLRKDAITYCALTNDLSFISLYKDETLNIYIVLYAKNIIKKNSDYRHFVVFEKNINYSLFNQIYDTILKQDSLCKNLTISSEKDIMKLISREYLIFLRFQKINKILSI
jgi:hypothetical protein